MLCIFKFILFLIKELLVVINGGQPPVVNDSSINNGLLEF